MALTLLHTKKEMLAFSRKSSRGFVPTMGALHEGHLALVRRALAENEEVVVSIFVNPTQFNNPADLQAYPRTVEADLGLLEPLGDLIVFLPTAEEMYQQTSLVSLQFGYLETMLEGEFRPGHFQGVGEVVSKLFHLTQPHRAYFGLKDLQQVAVIQAMVKGLDFPLEIIPCPTVREANGLAMSSRNQRLSSEAKVQAGDIYRGLQELAESLAEGKDWSSAKALIWDRWTNHSGWQPEYLALVSFPDLKPLDSPWDPQQPAAICMAVQVEGVRLIDNLLIGPI